MATLHKVPLYGGAMSMDIPSNMIDASAFRQVPDTQEVYVSKDNSETSLIVDLLEPVPASNIKEILDEHMAELTRLNGGLNTRILDCDENITSGEPLASLAGIRVFTQQVLKFGRAKDVEDVTIIMGVLRLADPANSDVLVTINRGVGEKTATGNNSPQNTQQLLHDFPIGQARDILLSLRVVDASLFCS